VSFGLARKEVRIVLSSLLSDSWSSLVMLSRVEFDGLTPTLETVHRVHDQTSPSP
jgi:hypothetical protein